MVCNCVANIFKIERLMSGAGARRSGEDRRGRTPCEGGSAHNGFSHEDIRDEHEAGRRIKKHACRRRQLNARGHGLESLINSFAPRSLKVHAVHYLHACV